MRTEQIPKRVRRILRLLWRMLDRLAFAALCTAAVLVPLRRRRYALVSAMLIGAAILSVLLALDRRNAKKEAARNRRETARTIRLEKLLLKSDAEIARTISEPSFVLLRSEHPSTGEVLSALRERPRCLAVLTDAERIAPLLAAYAPNTRLLDADALLRSAPVSCTESEVDRRLAAVQPKRKKPFRPSLFAITSRWKFLLLGTLLLVLSLAFRYKIYYRLLSAACFGMSAFSGLFAFQKQHRNFANFLDKREK